MKYCNTKRQRDYSILLSRLSHLQRKCVLRFSLERPEEMWASHVCWSYFNLGKKCSIRHKKFLEKRPGQIDFAWIKIYWEMGQNRPFGVHPLTTPGNTFDGNACDFTWWFFKEDNALLDVVNIPGSKINLQSITAKNFDSRNNITSRSYNLSPAYW